MQSLLRLRSAELVHERADCSTLLRPPDAAQANTQQICLRTQGMSHTEGGWPKDVDCTEAEHVIRYRRKVEKDEDYARSVVSLGCQVRRGGRVRPRAAP